MIMHFSLEKIGSHVTCAHVLKLVAKWTPVGHVTSFLNFH